VESQDSGHIIFVRSRLLTVVLLAAFETARVARMNGKVEIALPHSSKSGMRHDSRTIRGNSLLIDKLK
jgi:hypothetical protein